MRLPRRVWRCARAACCSCEPQFPICLFPSPVPQTICRPPLSGGMKLKKHLAPVPLSLMRRSERLSASSPFLTAKTMTTTAAAVVIAGNGRRGRTAETGRSARRTETARRASGGVESGGVVAVAAGLCRPRRPHRQALQLHQSIPAIETGTESGIETAGAAAAGATDEAAAGAAAAAGTGTGAIAAAVMMTMTVMMTRPPLAQVQQPAAPPVNPLIALLQRRLVGLARLCHRPLVSDRGHGRDRGARMPRMPRMPRA